MTAESVKRIVERYVTPGGRHLENIHLGCGVIIGYDRTARRYNLYNTCGYKTRQRMPGVSYVPGVTRIEERVEQSDLDILKRHFEDYLVKNGIHRNSFRVILTDDFHFRRIEYKLVVKY